MTGLPAPDEHLEDRGKRLWASMLVQHPAMSEAEREVALEACRVADRLERLDRVCRVSEPVIETDKGGLITHPAFAEARQQANLLKQLVASLRLPEPASGRRPQAHPGGGVNQPKGAGNVTALEKFRKASSE